MTLFVSNPSRQPVMFYYRTEISRDTSGPKMVMIPAGEQVELGHGWTREQTAYVIEQIMRKKGANAAEAHGKMSGDRFQWLLYREDHPVDEDEIVAAHEAVLEAARDRSVIQTTRSALAFDKAANKLGGRGVRGGRMAKSTMTEIQEEIGPHKYPTGNEMNFSMTVDPEGRSDIKLPV